MHAEHGKRVTSLNEPCFDLHYIARSPGRSTTPSSAPDIHYAMVVCLIQVKVQDLYERVVAAFPTVVAAIKPVIAITPPIEVSLPDPSKRLHDTSCCNGSSGRMRASHTRATRSCTDQAAAAV
jgi:hypothetical protein